MKAVVAFDTMWKSTELMARAISEGLASAGATVRVMGLQGSTRSDIATELLEAGAFLVGSPTINNGMFPTVADLLCYVRGLKPRNLVGQAFGSFGWSGEGAKQVQEELVRMGVEQVGAAVHVNYVPDSSALAACRALGRTVGERMKEKLG